MGRTPSVHVDRDFDPTPVVVTDGTGSVRFGLTSTEAREMATALLRAADEADQFVKVWTAAEIIQLLEEGKCVVGPWRRNARADFCCRNYVRARKDGTIIETISPVSVSATGPRGRWEISVDGRHYKDTYTRQALAEAEATKRALARGWVVLDAIAGRT